jgi:hypothetical protein
VKRVVSLFFLAILLLPIAGAYVYTGVRLTIIRQEMRQHLKTLPIAQLSVFIMTAQEYNQALVHEDELKLHGRMYDVARTEQKGNIVTIYALHDEAEDNVLAFLDTLVKRSTTDKKPVPPHLVQLLTLVFVKPPVVRSDCLAGFITHRTHYFFSDVIYSESVETPPPRG